MYGKSLQRNLNQSYCGSQIVENPEMLNTLDEIKIEIPELPVTEIPKAISPNLLQGSPVASSVLVPVNKQVETRLPDGKRRITPMFLKPVLTTPTKYEFLL